MPFVQIDGTDIHYTDQGEGRPVVLLHGRSASAACWDWHITRLRKHCRVIAYDSVNHGFSDNSPRDVPEPDRREELDGFLGALGLERPVLVGQSQGAMTVLRWAVRNPGRAASLVVTGMGWPLTGDHPMNPLVDGLWIDSRGFEAGWAAEHPEVPAQYSRVRSTATSIEATRHPRPLSPGAREFFDEDFGDRLRTITDPVHIAVGDLDFAAAPARNLATLLPHAELTVLEGAAHSAYLQSLDTFLDVVFRALDD
ncbi:alpha/beta hydrolase [Streptomyces sp. VNUA24]|uniref:alpha/beta fold hydrolase n=1 Tax=Streptomyces sp. VNUA24 TaxID=3031131 RepID=UPI0023B7BB5B|nr:alpha/beta hydrolase [Streptomyces sp. VNUA24]WEH12878.1 alpha/beta hydrolase [Streptomyces sp. VNUA24]